MGKQWKQCQTSFFWAPKSLQMVTAAMKLKDVIFLGSKIMQMVTAAMKLKKTIVLWKKSYGTPGQCFKKQRYYFIYKGPYRQCYGFSSSHAWMWVLNYKEGWALKDGCFWTVVLENLLRVSWTARRSSQSILKKISPEYSLEGLMLKLKLQYLGQLTGTSGSLEKTLMLGNIEGGQRRGR